MTADIGNLQARKMFKSITKSNAKQLDVQQNTTLTSRQSGFSCKDSLLIRRRPKVPNSSRSILSATNSDDESLYEPASGGKPLKSILKNNSVNSSDNSSTRTQQKKTVTFGIKKVRSIEPFLPYAADMWWSKAETSTHKKNQSDFSNATAIEKEQARKYLKGVHRGRNKLRKMQDDSNPTKSSPNDLLVLKDSYQQLLEGRIYGLAGLETYMSGHSEVRQSMFKIVERYQSIMQHSPKQNDDSDTDFYSFVRSVTAADRAWAEILGRVDAEAAQNNPADLV